MGTFSSEGAAQMAAYNHAKEAGGLYQQAQDRWYYSQLIKIIEDKMPNKASADQIRGLLKGQVKTDELKSTHLEECDLPTLFDKK